MVMHTDTAFVQVSTLAVDQAQINCTCTRGVHYEIDPVVVRRSAQNVGI